MTDADLRARVRSLIDTKRGTGAVQRVAVGGIAIIVGEAVAVDLLIEAVARFVHADATAPLSPTSAPSDPEAPRWRTRATDPGWWWYYQGPDRDTLLVHVDAKGTIRSLDSRGRFNAIYGLLPPGRWLAVRPPAAPGTESQGC